MTECGDIRKQFGCIYMTSSHLITCLCWWKKNHVGCFPVEVMGSMLNEQISCVLVEWSLLAAVSCWGLLLYCIVESPPPPSCVWLQTRDSPCYSTEEAQECTQECPSECLLTLVWPLHSQMSTKTFCWDSLGSLPGEDSGSCEAVTQDIATAKTWMETRGPHCSRLSRDLGAQFWCPDQFLLYLVSSSFLTLLNGVRSVDLPF